MKIDHCTNVFIMFKNLYSEYIYLFIRKDLFCPPIRICLYVTSILRFLFLLRVCVRLSFSLFIPFNIAPVKWKVRASYLRCGISSVSFFCDVRLTFTLFLFHFIRRSCGDFYAAYTFLSFFHSSSSFSSWKEKKRQTHHIRFGNEEYLISFHYDF